MTGPGKCAVRTRDPLTTDRGLVVRVASLGANSIPPSTLAIITAVADSATDVLLVSEDTGPGASRMKVTITNDSTVTLFLAIGGQTASTTVYSVQIGPGEYFETPDDIAARMEMRGIWASDPNTGAARITQYFP